MKRVIRYVGKHMPQGNYEVNVSQAEILLVSPNWVLPNKVERVNPIKKAEITFCRNDLIKMEKEMGWKSFQKYAKKTWQTTDTSKEELFDEILEKIGI